MLVILSAFSLWKPSFPHNTSTDGCAASSQASAGGLQNSSSGLHCPDETLLQLLFYTPLLSSGPVHPYLLPDRFCRDPGSEKANLCTAAVVCQRPCRPLMINKNHGLPYSETDLHVLDTEGEDGEGQPAGHELGPQPRSLGTLTLALTTLTSSLCLSQLTERTEGMGCIHNQNVV